MQKTMKKMDKKTMKKKNEKIFLFDTIKKIKIYFNDKIFESIDIFTNLMSILKQEIKMLIIYIQSPIPNPHSNLTNPFIFY